MEMMIGTVVNFFRKKSKYFKFKHRTEEIKKDSFPSIASFPNVLDETFKKFFQKYIEKDAMVLGDLHVGIWVVDVVNEGKVLYCSPGIQQITGFSQTQFESGDIKWESIIFEEDLEMFEKRQSLLYKGETLNHSYRIISANQKIVWIQDHTIPTLNESGKLIRLSGFVIDVTEQKIAEEKVYFYSHYDQVTGLSNRKVFEQEVKRKLASPFHHHFSILYIDINRFKSIIETFGNVIGDEVIKKVADMLLEFKINNGIISRIGWDQFAIIVPTEDMKYPVVIAQNLLEKLREPLDVKGYKLYCSLNIGIANNDCNDIEVDELLRNTELALYKAIAQGKNTYHVFSSSLDVDTFKQLQLEKDLSYAIMNNELVLHYQPKVETKTGLITGAEALVRWNHPIWGIISPLEFIPIAEETGFIIEIGDWVLRTVCETLANWEDQQIPVVPISINVSGQKFLKSNFAEEVFKVLSETKVKPSLLEFEITETSLIGDAKIVIETMNQLKMLGIGISIDDFGTGFSSISYLRQFRVMDTLKIDRSFIKYVCENHYDATIVKSIVQLAHGLQMKVVAEGVETEGQLAFLKAIDCSYIQGFYFSKPIAKSEFERMLEGNEILPIKQSTNVLYSKNRRKFIRVAFPKSIKGNMTVVKVKNRNIDLGKTAILIEDISAGGMRILSNICIPSREDITLQFEMELLGEQTIVLGQIVWLLEKDNGFFQYGVSFDISSGERDHLVKLVNTLGLRLTKGTLR
jgi:diguanylate cyclase (GGDEF)-like protein/PAS domain S-box-containing protein